MVLRNPTVLLLTEACHLHSVSPLVQCLVETQSLRKISWNVKSNTLAVSFALGTLIQWKVLYNTY